MKKIHAHFFATDSGNEPVREWLLALGDPDKQIIGQDIKSIEFGWPRDYHPPSLVKNLDGKVNEVRSNVSGGRIARVLFAVIGREMVLLHGFIKKSQKTPKADLDLAKSRLRDFERG